MGRATIGTSDVVLCEKIALAAIVKTSTHAILRGTTHLLALGTVKLWARTVAKPPVATSTLPAEPSLFLWPIPRVGNVLVLFPQFFEFLRLTSGSRRDGSRFHLYATEKTTPTDGCDFPILRTGGSCAKYPEVCSIASTAVHTISSLCLSIHACILPSTTSIFVLQRARRELVTLVPRDQDDLLQRYAVAEIEKEFLSIARVLGRARGVHLVKISPIELVHSIES
jgi:hypothetical protein